MKSNNSFKFFALALLVLTSVPAVNAADEAGFFSKVGSGIKYTAGIALLGSMFRFYSRHPEATPVRYNLDDIEEGKDVWTNMFYLIDDGLIGHKAKHPSLRANPETGKVEAHAGCYPKGVYGWVHNYATPMLKALSFPVNAALFVAASYAGKEIWDAFTSGYTLVEEGKVDKVYNGGFAAVEGWFKKNQTAAGAAFLLAAAKINMPKEESAWSFMDTADKAKNAADAAAAEKAEAAAAEETEAPAPEATTADADAAPTAEETEAPAPEATA